MAVGWRTPGELQFDTMWQIGLSIRYARPHHHQYILDARTGRILAEAREIGPLSNYQRGGARGPSVIEREENERTQNLRELKAKLDEAAGQAARGELVDGDEAFDDLRREIVERRRSRAKRHLA